jgi:3',5'-cyclic AMP phosphodiesterase CpdA
MYPASVFPGKCPAVLGNHDYHDNAGGEQVQLAYAKQGGTRWTLPAKWYREDLGELVTFLFLDTNLRSVSGSSKSKDGKVVKKNCLTADEEMAQWAWLKEQLASKRGIYTIVVGHHPVYSNGSHGDTKELVEKLSPQLQAAGVHLYLCGHDHDLQHLELEGLKTSHVLSGGGGARVRELKNKDRKMPFGTPVYGFSHLQLNQQRVVLRHVDANGKQIHAFEKGVDYTVKIVS